MEQIHYVQDELYELKQMMVDNVNYLLDRGEKLEELQEKTQLLEDQSMQFKKGSKKVRRHEWWVKNKVKVAVGTVTGCGLAYGLFLLI